ncbi:MAG: serine hydrolase, partial [Ignavibacteriales bacterium]|nr:serine hydrolase [Ignavibacteriales bacterium]
NPIINTRAYSDNTKITNNHSSAFIRGLNKERVISTAKHFPGHGSTNIDSHSKLPRIDKSKEKFYAEDLLPFIEAINSDVKSIMIGHLEVPAFEKTEGLPASLSYSIVTELLQDQLGFDGLIVTDALNMQAITKNFSEEESVLLALKAGNDILLFPKNAETALNTIYDAVINGDVNEERIDRSVRKILAAKKWSLLEEKEEIDLSKLSDTLFTKSHVRLAEEIAQRSITLIRDENKIIPIDPTKYLTTTCIILDDGKNGKGFAIEKALDSELKYYKLFKLNISSETKEFTDALKFAYNSDLILMAIYQNVRAYRGDLKIEDRQLDLIKALVSFDKPVVIMSFGNPYVVAEFSDADTYLCGYSKSAVTQYAMLKAIVGKSNITGQLPVSIPKTTFNVGDGIILVNDELKFQTETDSTYDFTEVDNLMNDAVMDKVFPGGVLLVGHKGKVIYNKAFGKFTYDSDAIDMMKEAIFDLASVSKVVGTTSAAMILFDEGKLDLEKYVSDYLPEFGNNGKEKIKIKNLLMHNSGLPAWKQLYKMFTAKEEAYDYIMKLETEFTAGSNYLYSDLGMITLQFVIEKITGKRLDEYLKEKLFIPLGMLKTTYNPPIVFQHYCVPTEVDDYWRMTTVKGKVHDENAYLLGGIAGHAGLFSSTSNLAIFCQMILNNGKYKNKQIIKESTIKEWTKLQSEDGSRGYGWGIKTNSGYCSGGSKISEGSIGHTGFTGTSIWIDKKRELFVVLLTNRVHPTRENNKIGEFRPVIHNAIISVVDYIK